MIQDANTSFLTTTKHAAAAAADAAAELQQHNAMIY